jgi:hypothetical protein
MIAGEPLSSLFGGLLLSKLPPAWNFYDWAGGLLRY